MGLRYVSVVKGTLGTFLECVAAAHMPPAVSVSILKAKLGESDDRVLEELPAHHAVHVLAINDQRLVWKRARS